MKREMTSDSLFRPITVAHGFLLAALGVMLLALLVTVWLENRCGTIWALALSPDGRQLTAVYNTEKAQVWDVLQDDAEPAQLSLASDATHGVVPSTPQYGGPRLLVAYRRSRSRDAPDGYELWDTAAKRRVRVLQLPYRAGPFYVSAKNGLILTSADDRFSTLDLFNVESGEFIGSLEGGESVEGQLRNQYTISADGRRVVASFDGFGTTDVMKVWNTDDRQCIRSFPVESGYGPATSPDGRLLAEAGERIWNLETGEKLASLDAGRYGHSSIAFSPGGKMLALGFFNRGMVRVCDATDGRLLATLTCAPAPLDAGFRTFVAFSADGKTLATGTGRTVQLWDAATFGLKKTLAVGHRGSAAILYSAAFILWSVIWGRLSRRRNARQAERPGDPSTRSEPLFLLRTLWGILGLLGLITIACSTFNVFVPCVCSLCTRWFISWIAYGGIGVGLFALTRAVGRAREGLRAAAVLPMLCILDSSVITHAILVLGGIGLVLATIITRRTKPEEEPGQKNLSGGQTRTDPGDEN